MPTLTFPTLSIAPAAFQLGLRTNTKTFRSATNRAVQTVEFPGACWMGELRYDNRTLIEADRLLLQAFIAQLRGAAGRFYLWDMAHPSPSGVATLDPTRTNHLIRSREFDNAAWTKAGGVSVTANGATAPDGTTTAEVVSGIPSNATALSQSTASIVGTSTFTFSIWLRGSGTTRIGLTNNVDPLTGQQITLSATWTRYTVTATFGMSTNTVEVRLYNVTGDTATGYEVFGAQLEGGSNATSYVVTTSSTDVRISGLKVYGAGQTGTTLVTAGWTGQTQNILRAGDLIGVNGELKRLVTSANSDLYGRASLTFEPPLRASPSDGATITISQPTFTAMLIDDEQDNFVVTPPLLSDGAIRFAEAFT